LIIIIIITKSLINSAALKNSEALQAYVIQCCGTGVPSKLSWQLGSFDAIRIFLS